MYHQVSVLLFPLAIIISNVGLTYHREAPSTTRHWITDRGFRFDVYTDATLDVTNSMVGSFDLSQYYQATKGVVLGSYFVCMPGVVVIGGDGKVVSRYVAPSPGKFLLSTASHCLPDTTLTRCCGFVESVQLSIADIFRMAGFK